MSKKTVQPKSKFYTDKQLSRMKLWRLMEIALVDMAKHQSEPNSLVLMEYGWLSASEGLPCRACFAGSVLRFTRRIDPVPYGTKVHDRPAWAWALNCLRSGDVSCAISHMRQLGVDTPHKLDRAVPSYALETSAWWASMLMLQADLKKANI